LLVQNVAFRYPQTVYFLGLRAFLKKDLLKNNTYYIKTIVSFEYYLFDDKLNNLYYVN